MKIIRLVYGFIVLLILVILIIPYALFCGEARTMRIGFSLHNFFKSLVEDL